MMKKAALFRKIKNKNVMCLACAHYCVISNGSKGICGVRQNLDGVLYLNVYGAPASMALDPVEKKPLYHFLPGTKILSIGTVGCNMKCEHCQNFSISQESAVQMSSTALPGKIVALAAKNKSRSIAFTYNEPAIFVEYAYDIARLAKRKRMKTVFVTNGYESKESLKYISKYLDAMNIDLKSFSNDFYINTCKAQLKPVLETIRLAHKLRIWVEVTTLVIPGKNDSTEELASIAGFIAAISTSIPWHITSFHPDYKMLDIMATPDETLLKAYNIGRNAGLKYVYIGNISIKDCETTYCPECKKALVKRAHMQVIENNLRNTRCKYCKARIEGIWK